VFFVIRLIFILLSTWCGYLIGNHFAQPTMGALAGLLGSGTLILLELYLGRIPTKVMITASLGLASGLIIANLLVFSLLFLSGTEKPLPPYTNLLLGLFLGYLGLIVGIKRSEEIVELSSFLSRRKDERAIPGSLKIVDTSVIIDGRIADICEVGFMEGTLIIPRFVLRELQQIADSSDILKRNRGRRGLDILNRIQKKVSINVQIQETDFPDVREVDAKLVKLARILEAKIMTNDYNLNKIAELEGVTVLNINELAEALKPVVLPGEEMTIRVIKEGKEPRQGVAYLDDGTMVVVDNGRDCIGEKVSVTVTSVLQTTAGRMIFTKLKE